MRLFTGLDVPPDVVKNLEELLRRLKPTASIQWSPLANLHITTKFIGEWPDARLAELLASLSDVNSRDPIRVAVHKLGFFPNPSSPRVFWCGIEAPGLERLAVDTDEAVGRVGVAREDRAYSPHLTLARIKDRIDFRPLHQAIAGLKSLEFGTVLADRFFLYQSTRSRAGSVYTKLAEFPLTKP
jgi:RNA 2',3'-cyclic 3'-phosphodiesterase